MRKLQSGLALCALAAVAACSDTSGPGPSGTASSAATPGASNPTGRHIVEFAGAAPADFTARVTALGGSVVWSSGEAGLATVSGLSTTAAATLSRRPGVKSVNDDITISLEAPTIDAVADAGVDGVASQAAPATSFFFARQWNMRAVHADQAWAAGFLGSPSVSVFLLDTGIDYNYIDLQGRVDLTRSVDLLGTFSVGGVPSPRRTRSTSISRAACPSPTCTSTARTSAHDQQQRDRRGRRHLTDDARGGEGLRLSEHLSPELGAQRRDLRRRPWRRCHQPEPGRRLREGAPGRARLADQPDLQLRPVEGRDDRGGSGQQCGGHGPQRQSIRDLLQHAGGHLRLRHRPDGAGERERPLHGGRRGRGVHQLRPLGRRPGGARRQRQQLRVRGVLRHQPHRAGLRHRHLRDRRAGHQHGVAACRRHRRAAGGAAWPESRGDQGAAPRHGGRPGPERDRPLLRQGATQRGPRGRARYSRRADRSSRINHRAQPQTHRRADRQQCQYLASGPYCGKRGVPPSRHRPGDGSA